MPLAVGDTCIEGDAIMTVHGGRRPIPSDAVRRAISLERQRTFDQDPKYALRLLVDVAIKALSPAVNDPTTAVQTLDEIEDLLRRIGMRNLEVGHVRDTGGVLRVVVPTPTWEDFLSLAFDEIRSCGATSLQVMRRLRAALINLEGIAPPSRRGDPQLTRAPRCHREERHSRLPGFDHPCSRIGRVWVVAQINAARRRLLDTQRV